MAKLPSIWNQIDRVYAGNTTYKPTPPPTGPQERRRDDYNKDFSVEMSSSQHEMFSGLAKCKFAAQRSIMAISM